MLFRNPRISRPCRRTRIIDQLRKAYPGKWSYHTLERKWIGPEFDVVCYSRSAPCYDGDDDNFVVVYFREDTGEQIHIL